MKIKKIRTFISSIFAVLLTASSLSFCTVCAMDVSPTAPSLSPANQPQQKSIAQNKNEIKNHNEVVAPSEPTSQPKVQTTNPQKKTDTPAPAPSPTPTPSTQNTPAPDVPAAPAAPPSANTPPLEPSPAQHKEENQLPIQKSSEENSKDSNKADAEDTEGEEEHKTPEDLPEVESDEIIFPEVMSPAEETTQKPKNFLAGIIAWTCIILGIAIVIFVLIKGHHKGEIEPKTMKVHSSGHKKKTKRLLDDKYYKKR